MSKYLQFILVIVYAFLLIGSFFVVIDVFGWLHRPLRDSVVFGSVLAWLLFCFSAPYFLTGFFLLFMNIRQPLLEEEQKLRLCLEDIRQRANDHKRYLLLTEEEKGMNASAIGYRTIAVTRGLLAGLTDDETKAVMAHELGHLATRDCVASMAFSLTGFLSRCVSFVLHHLLHCIRLVLRKMVWLAAGWAGILGLAVLALVLYHFHILKYGAAILSYGVLLTFFDKLFQFLWRLNSRYTEYRQDVFAQELGLGEDLRKALMKMMARTPQKVNFFHIFQSDHPFTHNRIRRLEKLEGLRE